MRSAQYPTAVVPQNCRRIQTAVTMVHMTYVSREKLDTLIQSSELGSYMLRRLTGTGKRKTRIWTPLERHHEHFSNFSIRITPRAVLKITTSLFAAL